MASRLKVMCYNLENFFLLSDVELTSEHLKLDPIRWQRLSTSIYDNKPLQKLIWIQKLIQETNPDVLMLSEVGGHESLKNFNRLFLNNSYLIALTEGNSDRNIDVGYLVKKDLGIYFDLYSNKNRPLHFLYPHEIPPAHLPPPTIQSHKFSRDVAELHLFTTDREKPFLIFLLTHLKSRLDPEGIDNQGFLRRKAELESLVEIYNELKSKHPQAYFCVGGDFNGNATITPPNTLPYDSEFNSLFTKTDLLDVCSLSGLNLEQSATYYQVMRGQRTEARQLDYCFISNNLKPLLDKASVKVYRYLDSHGIPYDPPKTMEEKQSFPSDHYPLLFEIKNLDSIL